MTIIIDTREQAPWSFPPEYCETRRGTLSTGDYALDGDQENFAIERKSLDDFLGTISSGWERFQREMKRMDAFIAKVIIVESDFERCCFREWDGTIVPPSHNHPQLTPSFISRRIAELALRRVSTLFASSPDQAMALAYQLFRRRAEELERNK